MAECMTKVKIPDTAGPIRRVKPEAENTVLYFKSFRKVPQLRSGQENSEGTPGSRHAELGRTKYPGARST